MNPGKAFERSPREIEFYEFDGFRLYVKKEELLKNGIPLALTHKAFQVLLVLVQNSGQTVEKEDIYQRLWGDSFVEDANLTQHIYVLRKTLGSSSTGDTYIETVARSGYRFNAITRSIYNDTGAPQNISQSRKLTLLRPEAENKVSDETTPGVDDVSKRYRSRFLAAAALIAVLVAAAIAFRVYVTPPNSTLSQSRSVAVLPFKAIGEESSNEKLGLGMADAIITRLSRLRSIPVRPTSSVFRYTDSPPESSAAAGKDLGVDTVLEGTVQRDSDRVRVSVRLISVADGNTVLAESFDENSTDIFSLQDSISARVVRALRLSLTSQQETSLTQHATANTEAYDAYQQGVYFSNLRTKDGLEQAISYFQKSVSADPNYGRAYGMLSDSYSMLAYYRFADPDDMNKKAAAAAEKALELDDTVPETYIALAYLQLMEKGGLQRSKEYLEKAIDIAPYNSIAHVRYGWVLLNLEDLNGASDQMRLAQQYDPGSNITNGALCDLLSFQGKYDEGVKYCEKSATISPDSGTSQLALAEAYFAVGRRDDAIALGEKIVASEQGDDRLYSLGSLGYFYAKSGERPKAEAILKELKSSSSRLPALFNDLAIIYFALGDRDEGYASFQQAYTHRSLVPFRLRYDPAWADVRADERIAKLIAGH